MCSEHMSVEDFLAHSFGLCPVHSNEVAGWCMAEYNVGDRCEIGIATTEKHRRKGIARLTTWDFSRGSSSARLHPRRLGLLGTERCLCCYRSQSRIALVEEYPAVVVDLS